MNQAMNHKPGNQLSCFGRLECVFPKSEDGLRHTPQPCLQCSEKVECLRTAVQSEEGQIVREEKLDRAYASGHVGFLERWSRKKKFQQRKQPRGKIGEWLQKIKKITGRLV